MSNRYIRCYAKGSSEYKKLEAAAKMMTEKSPNRLVYYVGDSYTSFGYAWIWTTVLCDTDKQGFQALYPDEQQAIIESEDLEAVVDKILNDEFSMENQCA